MILSRSTSADQTSCGKSAPGSTQTLSCSSSLHWLIIPSPIIYSHFSRWSCNTFRFSLGQDVPLLVHWQEQLPFPALHVFIPFIQAGILHHTEIAGKGNSSSLLILLVGKINQSPFLICSHQLSDGCFLLFKKTQNVSKLILIFWVLGKIISSTVHFAYFSSCCFETDSLEQLRIHEIISWIFFSILESYQIHWQLVFMFSSSLLFILPMKAL